MLHWQLKRVKVIFNMSFSTPKLLLHCCCAPCAVSVVEQLSVDYEITLFFYNPNIDSLEEYNKRADEMGKISSGKIIIHEYNSDDFNRIAEMYPDEPEGGVRCIECFKLRLSKTADMAESNGYDFFTTTLSVSPHKDAELINDIGCELTEDNNKSAFLCADFKKQDGFKRSVKLSKQYGLYRQNYCGCRFSRYNKGG